MHRLQGRINSAHVLALLALFVALGGTGYAALKLPENSVGSKQIRNNAVTTSKVKNSSLLANDFAAGQLPAGPQGTAAAFARVGANGLLDDGSPPQNENVVQSDVQHEAAGDATHTGPGIYCFGGLPFAPRSAMVTADSAGAQSSTNFIASVSVQRGNNLNSCDADHQQARVSMLQVNNTAAPTLADHGFYIWFEK